jgi:hypothetical protein
LRKSLPQLRVHERLAEVVEHEVGQAAPLVLLDALGKRLGTHVTLGAPHVRMGAVLALHVAEGGQLNLVKAKNGGFVGHGRSWAGKRPSVRGRVGSLNHAVRVKSS